MELSFTCAATLFLHPITFTKGTGGREKIEKSSKYVRETDTDTVYDFLLRWLFLLVPPLQLPTHTRKYLEGIQLSKKNEKLSLQTYNYNILSFSSSSSTRRLSESDPGTHMEFIVFLSTYKQDERKTYRLPLLTFLKQASHKNTRNRTNNQKNWCSSARKLLNLRNKSCKKHLSESHHVFISFHALSSTVKKLFRTDKLQN